MSRSTRDAAIDLIRVCRDGIQIVIGSKLQLPSADGGEPPLPAAGGGPGQQERCRIVAASPPPTRAGQPWTWGILVAGSEPPTPIDPASARTETSGTWRQGVDWIDPIPDLDTPVGDAIVLDEQRDLNLDPDRTMTFKEDPEQFGFLSVRYPQPYELTPPLHTVGVRFSGEFTLRWRRPLAPGDWVAISLENFAPGRESADYLAQVQDCTL